MLFLPHASGRAWSSRAVKRCSAAVERAPDPASTVLLVAGVDRPSAEPGGGRCLFSLGGGEVCGFWARIDGRFLLRRRSSQRTGGACHTDAGEGVRGAFSRAIRHWRASHSFVRSSGGLGPAIQLAPAYSGAGRMWPAVARKAWSAGASESSGRVERRAGPAGGSRTRRYR